MEIVRLFAQRWERSDWDGMAELVDPEVEMHSTVGGVEEGRLRQGVDEIRRDYEKAGNREAPPARADASASGLDFV